MAYCIALCEVKTLAYVIFQCASISIAMHVVSGRTVLCLPIGSWKDHWHRSLYERMCDFHTRQSIGDSVCAYVYVLCAWVSACEREGGKQGKGEGERETERVNQWRQNPEEHAVQEGAYWGPLWAFWGKNGTWQSGSLIFASIFLCLPPFLPLDLGSETKLFTLLGPGHTTSDNEPFVLVLFCFWIHDVHCLPT